MLEGGEVGGAGRGGGSDLVVELDGCNLCLCMNIFDCVFFTIGKFVIIYVQDVYGSLQCFFKFMQLFILTCKIKEKFCSFVLILC